MSEDKKKVYITLIAGIAVVSVLVIGLLTAVLLHMSNSKKEEIEATTEAATEEKIAEEVSEDASEDASWFADKTIYNPVMTPETISLPKAA